MTLNDILTGEIIRLADRYDTIAGDSTQADRNRARIIDRLRDNYRNVDFSDYLDAHTSRPGLTYGTWVREQITRLTSPDTIAA